MEPAWEFFWNDDTTDFVNFNIFPNPNGTFISNFENLDWFAHVGYALILGVYLFYGDIIECCLTHKEWFQ